MGQTEYKTYDSDDTYTMHNATLTHDPRVVEGNNGPIVSIKFVSTCRSDRYTQLWVEATVQDFQAGLARHLKKGDTLSVVGKPGLRPWTDKEGADRVSFELLRAEIKVPIKLFMEMKDRGFTPGASKPNGKKNAAKGNTKAAPAKGKKQITQIPDDDEDTTEQSDDADDSDS